jgi:hypothetical protein
MRRYLDTLPAALLVATHFVLAADLEVLYGNRMEFEFGLGSILPPLVAVALAVTVLLCLLGAALPAPARSRFVAVVFAIGILGWFQSSFLHGNYGQFTGEVIDWSRYPVRGWVDLSLWLAVIAAAVMFHEKLRPKTRFIAPLLAVLLLAGLGGRALLSPAEAPPASEEVDPASLSQFSRRQNVVQILMDGFQTDTFLELVEEEELADDLDGFTVFRDNAAVAAYTHMSIPAIFSGEIYDGTETPAQYHHRALRENGFHHRLFEEGFGVYLVPKIPMTGGGFTMYAETPEHYGLSRTARIRKQVLAMFDLGLFRSSPHFLRRVIYNGGNWRLARAWGEPVRGLNTHQRAFFADFIDRMQVTLDQPAYHFVHLMPPHDPFVTLPDGTDAGRVLPNNHGNFKTEAHFILHLFLDLLERMRELGIYDDALIILHADHGFGPVARQPGDHRVLKVPRAPALLAVKRMGAHGPLRYSDAPTTVADIPATIFGELGLPHDYPGRSVFELPERLPRTRIFNSYSLGSNHDGIISRFELNGSIYDPQAWTPLGDRPVDLGQPIYNWGDLVDFGVGGDSDRFLGRDWSPGGAAGCRINQRNRATVVLKAPPNEKEVRAVFTFRPRLREGEDRQFGIRFYSNGVFVGERKFERPRQENFEFIIPAGNAPQGKFGLEFEFLDYGGGRRGAVGALCLISMRMEPK